MRVSEGAEKNLFLKPTGGVPGPWTAAETPYMIEPLDTVGSRRHEGIVFVGPARTGKTAALLLGSMSHMVVNDPGDMLFVQMTQDKAREFSKVDVDRAIRYSPALQSMIGSKQDDNTHDKMFRNGMWLRIAWPTVSNVSGSTYRYAFSTDYDRVPDDIDGEGSLWGLMLKRTQTFLSRGMALAESSPGRELNDPHWRPVTQHEAPPCTGILSLYNRSDRRRFYWKCPMCDEWFEAKPGVELFRLPSDDVLLEIVREADLEAIANEHNRVICPHCQGGIGPRSKQMMNARGRWLKDGLVLTRTDEIIGTPHESSIAGFWLGGVPAAYQSWKSIILRYLQGLREYVLTGSELSLQVTTNTDQGMPYMPRALLEVAKAANDPNDRKEADLKRYVVPEKTRFVTASVDVQGGMSARFEVQVHAVGPHNEKWLIDRYAIKESKREGIGGFAPIDPAAYPEDWDILTEKVVRATFRTPLEGKEILVRMVVVDSGGEEGVTDNAYEWYRRVRQQGMANRVMLIKGVGRKATSTTPMIRESWVGGRGAKNGEGKVEQNDIPLYLINTNMIKDIISNGLKRQAPGPGYIHFPSWLLQSVMDELKSETRNADGTWTQIRKRNETWDLLCYCEVACMRLATEKINWNRAPEWARPLAQNSDVITIEERRDMKDNELIEQPAPVNKLAPRAKARRRVRHSSYLR